MGRVPLAPEQVVAHGRGSRSPCCTATRARPAGTGLRGHCVKTTSPRGSSRTPRGRPRPRPGRPAATEQRRARAEAPGKSGLFPRRPRTLPRESLFPAQPRLAVPAARLPRHVLISWRGRGEGLQGLRQKATPPPGLGRQAWGLVPGGCALGPAPRLPHGETPRSSSADSVPPSLRRGPKTLPTRGMWSGGQAIRPAGRGQDPCADEAST